MCQMSTGNQSFAELQLVIDSRGFLIFKLYSFIFFSLFFFLESEYAKLETASESRNSPASSANLAYERFV